MVAVPTAVAPQESVRIPVGFGFGATWYATGYTVAPGSYELVAVVTVTTMRNVGSQARYRTEGVPVTVEGPGAV